jgi:hypothetical protein
MLNLTYEVTDTGYTILRDGKPWIVQDGEKPYFPYPDSTIEKSAQKHINAILEQNEQSENTPSLDDRVTALEMAQIAALGV